MFPLTTQFFDKSLDYTGHQLRPHFLYTQLGLKGSAIAAFEGGCNVKTGEMVDLEDVLANDRIEARRMVHFIGEFFGAGLREGVLLQRLLMAIMGERLRARGVAVERSGDDLFVGERKLSVSIVTASPVSVLLHTGINIDPAGAPVAAIGLAELKVDSRAWAEEVLAAVSEELSGVHWACAKVRPVF